LVSTPLTLGMMLNERWTHTYLKVCLCRFKRTIKWLFIANDWLQGPYWRTWLHSKEKQGQQHMRKKVSITSNLTLWKYKNKGGTAEHPSTFTSLSDKKMRLLLKSSWITLASTTWKWK
jgi:hypothetical protein